MEGKSTPGAPGELAHESGDGSNEISIDKKLGTPGQLHPKEAPPKALEKADPSQQS